MNKKHVLHIHPHVMGHSGHNNSDNQQDSDPFKNFFNHPFNGTHNHQGGNNHVHSFTATYSNVNGHVKRHVTNNGQNVSGRDAQNAMQQMRNQMKQLDSQMNTAFGDFGNLDHLMGIGDQRNNNQNKGHHTIKRLLNRFHHSK